jgi:cephalosporin hydroxylase
MDSPLPTLVPPAAVVDAFHRLYYHSLGWDYLTFLGYQIKQCPLDLHLYQELFFRVKPGYVIQTGVAGGGSVLYFASLLDLIGAPPEAFVIGIDVTLTPEARSLTHPRIRLLQGSSTSPEVVAAVRAMVVQGGGLVSLDSDHAAAHVLSELRLYSAFVAPGSYLVVEDTNINGHPVFPNFGPGPFEAAAAFFREDRRFQRDDDFWMRNLFSFHQWYRRIG